MEPEEIRKLWRDPRFSGCYSGLDNFQSSLKHEKKVTISKADLFDILKQDRNYILEMRKIKKKFPRRQMRVHGYGNVWQADIGQMFQYQKWNGFLLCIDIFSRRIFARKLTSKRALEVSKAFTSIFKEANIRPEKIETDQGSEFSHEFFRKNDIYFKVKVGANKARYISD